MLPSLGALFSSDIFASAGVGRARGGGDTTTNSRR
jgi:hypothetical protein